jgi:hypothetical protein
MEFKTETHTRGHVYIDSGFIINSENSYSRLDVNENEIIFTRNPSSKSRSLSGRLCFSSTNYWLRINSVIRSPFRID